MDIKQKVLEQFGKNAQAYVTSPMHSSREDLDILEEWVKADKPEHALDIATGGGHAAGVVAPLVARLTALDLTPEILQAAERFLLANGHTNVQYVLGDAETLPFESNGFDLVTCRIAAHHFPDPDAFVREVARVLAPSGSFLLLDNVSPESDEWDALYNQIEKDRDPSHARAWKKSEWIRKVEAEGLLVEQLLQFQKTFIYEPWCGRMGFSGDPKDELERFVLNQSQEAKRALGVKEANGKLISFQGKYMMLRARKPSYEA